MSATLRVGPMVVLILVSLCILGATVAGTLGELWDAWQAPEATEDIRVRPTPFTRQVQLVSNPDAPRPDSPFRPTPFPRKNRTAPGEIP